SGCAAALFGGRILVIGGERDGGVFTQNEAYDPSTDQWTTLAPLPEGRHGTGASVIGTALYVPVGAPVNGGSQQSSSLLIFTQ
ncbi:MAG: galactose oxidase, partial [Candidatus Eremiobacteraeota bacterium]|nr:galactose oxidase [Candidatus Eremiobacteraeota bacterium]